MRPGTLTRRVGAGVSASIRADEAAAEAAREAKDTQTGELVEEISKP